MIFFQNAKDCPKGVLAQGGRKERCILLCLYHIGDPFKLSRILSHGDAPPLQANSPTLLLVFAQLSAVLLCFCAAVCGFFMFIFQQPIFKNLFIEVNSTSIYHIFIFYPYNVYLTCSLIFYLFFLAMLRKQVCDASLIGRTCRLYQD
jgi:hypothetical protein